MSSLKVLYCFKIVRKHSRENLHRSQNLFLNLKSSRILSKAEDYALHKTYRELSTVALTQRNYIRFKDMKEIKED